MKYFTAKLFKSGVPNRNGDIFNIDGIEISENCDVKLGKHEHVIGHAVKTKKTNKSFIVKCKIDKDKL
jgi:hypothetical protein